MSTRQARAPRKRAYHSPQRTAQAEATRRRILDAAAGLFADAGVSATTMDAIARGAGVSVQTVYLAWSSKRAIVTALVAQLKEDADVGGLYRELVAESDPRRQLELAAIITRRFGERAWGVMDAIRLEGKGDEALRALWNDVEQTRLRGIGILVRSLAGRGALKEGLDAKEATDLVWSLCAHDLYRLLVVDRRWSAARYERWLADTMCALVLRGPEASR